MNKLLDLARRCFLALFSTKGPGLYILSFAIAIAVATFTENYFGTSSAQKVIFKTWWFTTLLTLFGISIAVNIFHFQLIQHKKWALLLFHVAMIVILLGDAVSRYFGFEGVMHIRENHVSDSFLSSDTYLPS